MGLRDRLRGKGREKDGPEQQPAAGELPAAEREALLAHMDAMLARGSMTEREYRQEHRRLFGEDP
jgi:hypothetical protein